MKTIKEGVGFSAETMISGQDLATAHGSGSLPVYATPAMVAFMENTACKLLEPYLQEGETTVGISIDVKHLKANLTGMKLYCQATLVAVEGRKYVFDIEVCDALSTVGTARHERFLVLSDPFLKKAKENKVNCDK